MFFFTLFAPRAGPSLRGPPPGANATRLALPDRYLAFPPLVHFAGPEQKLALIFRQAGLTRTGHLFQNGVQLGFQLFIDVAGRRNARHNRSGFFFLPINPQALPRPPTSNRPSPTP